MRNLFPIFAAFLLTGCVGANYSVVDANGVKRNFGFVRCLVNDNVGELSATAPDGTTIKLSGLQSNVDVQLAHEMTTQAAYLSSTASTLTGHGPLPIPVPLTIPAPMPATMPSK